MGDVGIEAQSESSGSSGDRGEHHSFDWGKDY